MDNFPTKTTGLSQGESPSLYDISRTENVLKAEVDGGYEFRRRRSTRARRKIIATGFIEIPHADYLVLDAFWEAHQEDVAFIYHDYMHNVDRQVRFDTFSAKYTGVGQNRMWTINIKMSEI